MDENGRDNRLHYNYITDKFLLGGGPLLVLLLPDWGRPAPLNFLHTCVCERVDVFIGKYRVCVLSGLKVGARFTCRHGSRLKGFVHSETCK